MWAPVMPEFPGGMDKLSSFISDHLIFPRMARENHLVGKVYVSWIVDKEGNVVNVTLEHGAYALLDEEAMRVIKSMPKWKPGSQNGRAVNVKLTMPISFILK
jgi:TonB family protein